jgi:UDP-N-acetylmuramyl pentapeptide synthase
VYASLAAAAVGLKYGMNLVEISQALKAFKVPKGRLNIVKGIKNTIIIDDTYNSSPQSCTAALEIVSRIELPVGAKKFAILGDMLELGSLSEKSHLEIGRQVYKNKISKLIIVGERSRDIARGAEKAGMSKDNIFHFAFSDEAGRFIQEQINQSDLILVKGSQGMRMEKIVKEIMAEPLRAKELLVRQDNGWLKK